MILTTVLVNNLKKYIYNQVHPELQDITILFISKYLSNPVMSTSHATQRRRNSLPSYGINVISTYVPRQTSLKRRNNVGYQHSEGIIVLDAKGNVGLLSVIEALTARVTYLTVRLKGNFNLLSASRKPTDWHMHHCYTASNLRSPSISPLSFKSSV